MSDTPTPHARSGATVPSQWGFPLCVRTACQAMEDIRALRLELMEDSGAFRSSSEVGVRRADKGPRGAELRAMPVIGQILDL